jgi:hypothetical protein
MKTNKSTQAVRLVALIRKTSVPNFVQRAGYSERGLSVTQRTAK